MKKIAYLTLLLCVMQALTSCGNTPSIPQPNNNTTLTNQQSTNNHPKTEDVQSTTSDWSGTWSLDGQGYEKVLQNGGVFLNCNITKQSEFTGYLYTQQGAEGRVAQIDITGTIDANHLRYPFEDDGWGGNGTLHLEWKENQITAWVEDYRPAKDNTSGYGISGSYELIRCSDSPYIVQQDKQPIDKSQYYQASAYYEEVTDYWENTREVRDIANVLEPLYQTDKQRYTAEDFSNDPPVIIHIAKNEIYARRGYVFKDKDLRNYFMGCEWYQPMEDHEEFDEAVFNEYEIENLQLLSKLDTYQKTNQDS